MKAVRFSRQTISMVDIPKPRPQKGEALIKTLMAGICNTDLELHAGYYDFEGVPGHEFVGLVEECPSDPSWVGKRVVADINLGCGDCEYCQKGQPRHCLKRRVIGIKHWDGAFAQYLKAPMANLIQIPPGLRDEQAVFAEPLAAALRVSRQVELSAEMKALVLGDGKLGLLCALGLKHFCPDLILAGRHQNKLEIARAQGVGTRLLDRAQGISGLQQDGPGFDLVVEATGSPDGLAQALELVRPMGTVAAKTTSHLPSTLNMAQAVVNEITILGSRCGDLVQALDFLSRGLLDVAPLVERVYDFREFIAAFDLARQAKSKKVLVAF